MTRAWPRHRSCHCARRARRTHPRQAHPSGAVDYICERSVWCSEQQQVSRHTKHGWMYSPNSRETGCRPRVTRDLTRWGVGPGRGCSPEEADGPHAPVTAQPFAQAIWAIALGFAAPWVVIVPVWLLTDRWRDRRALRRAKARWEAWHAAHPREPPREAWPQRWELRQQLWLESQPAHVHTYLLRQRLEEAEREVQVQAMLDAERRGDGHGR